MLSFLPHNRGKHIQIFSNVWTDRLVRVLRFWAELIEFPKRMLATFHWSIDGGYRNFASEEEQKKSKLHMFCCDTMMHLHNLPSCLKEGIEEGASKEKWWSSDTNSFDQQQIDVVMSAEQEQKGGTVLAHVLEP